MLFETINPYLFVVWYKHRLKFECFLYFLVDDDGKLDNDEEAGAEDDDEEAEAEGIGDVDFSSVEETVVAVSGGLLPVVVLD